LAFDVRGQAQTVVLHAAGAAQAAPALLLKPLAETLRLVDAGLSALLDDWLNSFTANA
jgi:hypothetical protein